MADKEKDQKTEKKIHDTNADSPKKALGKMKIQRAGGKRRPRKGDKKKRRRRGSDDGFDSKIISIRRVTRSYKGGKRMRLSVVAVVGDKKGRIGVGVGKGADVRAAEEKAVNYAKKHLVMIETKGDTIPHETVHKRGAAKVFLKPAAPGTGIIAGSAVRAVVELAGVKDILTKVIGTKNNINNAYATMEALTTLRKSRI